MYLFVHKEVKFYSAIPNYVDFAIFANTWLLSSGDGGYNETCDLVNDNIIDANDLAIFANEWLWMSCSKMVDAPIEEMSMSMSVSMSSSMELMSMDLAAIPQPEPTIEEQIERYEYLLDWLENLWKTDKSVRDEVDRDAFDGMIESLEAWLNELEDSL